MPKIIIISPEVSEDSAKLLAESLGVPYENPYKTEQRRFDGYSYVFSYGFSRPTAGGKRINKASSIETTKDKIKCLDLLKNIPTIIKTTSFETSKTWIKGGRIVVVRKILDGDNGEGLVYCTTIKELEKYKEAPLFTRYIHHVCELRINSWRGEVVSIYQKDIKNGLFKFKLIKGQEKHPQVTRIVKEVYEKIGIDWCGIDVVCTEAGNLYVLEVNSAPVLLPYTAKKLTSLIRKELK